MVDVPLDFPNSPAVGDKWPSPPVWGVPIYTWDGEKWLTQGAQVGNAGPATKLPLNDVTGGQVGTSMYYAREDHAHPTDHAYIDAQDALHVLKSGDTMLGPLTLPGAPTMDLHAATKKYVDDKLVALAARLDALEGKK
jgi:hypothetical protein